MDDYIIDHPYGRSSLLWAASDGRHRPASHPLARDRARNAAKAAPSAQQVYGYQVRAERQARGWSQRALAALIGVDPVTIRHWESGTNQPTEQHRRTLAEVFAR